MNSDFEYDSGSSVMDAARLAWARGGQYGEVEYRWEMPGDEAFDAGWQAAVKYVTDRIYPQIASTTDAKFIQAALRDDLIPATSDSGAK